MTRLLRTLQTQLLCEAGTEISPVSQTESSPFCFCLHSTLELAVANIYHQQSSFFITLFFLSKWSSQRMSYSAVYSLNLVLVQLISVLYLACPPSWSLFFSPETSFPFLKETEPTTWLLQLKPITWSVF